MPPFNRLLRRCDGLMGVTGSQRRLGLSGVWGRRCTLAARWADLLLSANSAVVVPLDSVPGG